VTGCPILGEPTPAKALELAPARDQLVPPDEPSKPSKPHAKHASSWRVASRRVIEQLLIGNSVFWRPSSAGEGCGGTQYFAPDGRIFVANCRGRGPTVTFVGESRWKFVRGRFCLQDRDEHDAFVDCDPFAIRAVPAPSDRSVRFRVYSSSESKDPSDDSVEPGIIMQGNPAGFLIEKP
jgi:hypothetical protein